MIDLSWMEKEKNIKRMAVISIIILVLLVGIDFFIEHHGEFKWTLWPGFSAIYGFISCVVIVVVSKTIGYFLKKKEEYYD